MVLGILSSLLHIEACPSPYSKRTRTRTKHRNGFMDMWHDCSIYLKMYFNRFGIPWWSMHWSIYGHSHANKCFQPHSMHGVNATLLYTHILYPAGSCRTFDVTRYIIRTTTHSPKHTSTHIWNAIKDYLYLYKNVKNIFLVFIAIFFTYCTNVWFGLTRMCCILYLAYVAQLVFDQSVEMGYTSS